MRLLNRSTANAIVQALSAPVFSHWIRKIEVRELSTGEPYVTAYIDFLTQLRIDDLNRAIQGFDVTWRADPSRSEQVIFIRITDRT